MPTTSSPNTQMQHKQESTRIVPHLLARLHRRAAGAACGKARAQSRGDSPQSISATTTSDMRPEHAAQPQDPGSDQRIRSPTSRPPETGHHHEAPGPQTASATGAQADTTHVSTSLQMPAVWQFSHDSPRSADIAPHNQAAPRGNEIAQPQRPRAPHSKRPPTRNTHPPRAMTSEARKCYRCGAGHPEDGPATPECSTGGHINTVPAWNIARLQSFRKKTSWIFYNVSEQKHRTIYNVSAWNIINL